MPRLNPIDPANATGNTAQLLDTVQQKLGVVPNLLRTFANSPAVLEAYLGFSGALAGASLGAQLSEKIALTVAGANGCDYCASAHTAIGKGAGIPRDELERNLEGFSSDERTTVILDFAATIVEKRGLVSDTDVAAVRAAGVSDAEIAEIVAAVALNLFTNYFNHVAGTDIDFPVVRASVAGVRAA